VWERCEATRGGQLQQAHAWRVIAWALTLHRERAEVTWDCARNRESRAVQRERAACASGLLAAQAAANELRATGQHDEIEVQVAGCVLRLRPQRCASAY
jgi:acetyl-CoA acetyltransferase